MAGPMDPTAKIIYHPTWGPTLFKPEGNIVLKGDFHVAGSTVQLPTVDDKNFASVLKKILLESPGVKASGVA